MNSHHLILTTTGLLFSVMLLGGCTGADYGGTSPYHPGPVAGQAVGTGIGVVAGNAAGFGAGVVSGTARGFVAPFNPNYHMVRRWRAEVTSDGRTVDVPYDILVDQYGRPVNMPAPTGNPAPPPMTVANTNSPSQ